ncbi:MAG TPA: hypothetical protein VIJ59_00700 [Caulobacteraceae bacterium]
MVETPPSGPSGQTRVDIGETEARGARRVGYIWILVASLAIAVVVLALMLVYFSGSLSDANRRGGPASIPKADAANFHTPPPPPAS